MAIFLYYNSFLFTLWMIKDNNGDIVAKFSCNKNILFLS